MNHDRSHDGIHARFSETDRKTAELYRHRSMSILVQLILGVVLVSLMAGAAYLNDRVEKLERSISFTWEMIGRLQEKVGDKR